MHFGSSSHSCPHVGIGNIAKSMQILYRGGPDFIRIAGRVFDNQMGQTFKLLNSASEWSHKLFQVICGLDRGGDKVTDFTNKQTKEFTLIGHGFAPHQVQCLNPVSALINLSNASIAHELLLSPFPDITVTAQNLLALYTVL